MKQDERSSSLPWYFWALLFAGLMAGPVLDQQLGYSWFANVSDALGISQVGLGAGLFVVILALVGIAQWVPRNKH